MANPVTDSYGMVETTVVPSGGFFNTLLGGRRISSSDARCRLLYRDETLIAVVNTPNDATRAMKDDRLYAVNLGTQRLDLTGTVLTLDRYTISYSVGILLAVSPNPHHPTTRNDTTGVRAFTLAYIRGQDPLGQVRQQLADYVSETLRQTAHKSITDSLVRTIASKAPLRPEYGLAVVSVPQATRTEDSRYYAEEQHRQNLTEIERKGSEESASAEQQERVADVHHQAQLSRDAQTQEHTREQETLNAEAARTKRLAEAVTDERIKTLHQMGQLIADERVRVIEEGRAEGRSLSDVVADDPFIASSLRDIAGGNEMIEQSRRAKLQAPASIDASAPKSGSLTNDASTDDVVFSDQNGSIEHSALGITISRAELDPSQREQADHAVESRCYLVVKVSDSGLAKGKLRAGNLIVRIDGNHVPEVAEMQRILSEVPRNRPQPLKLDVLSGEQYGRVTISMPTQA